MRRVTCCLIILGGIVGCGPPEALREMHAAFNQGQWAAVTEKFADLGRPRDLNGVSYARVGIAATEVYVKSKSPAYLDLAIDCYQLAADRDRSLADGHHFARGELLLYANRKDEAIAAYLDALAVNARHVGAAWRAAVLLTEAKRAADASRAARGLLAVRRPVNQQLLQGLSALASAEASLGRHDAAIKVLRHAASIGPSTWGPDILYALACCYQAQNENGPARMAMRRALAALPEGDSRRPRFDKYLEDLERASRTATREPAPEPTIDTGPRVAPPPQEPADSAPEQPAPAPPPLRGHSPEARAVELAAKASVLAAENKVEEAISLLEEAVGLAPRLPAPPAQLANLYVKQGRYAKAVEVLETAIGHNPDNVILKQMLDKLRSALAAESRPGR
ncbi:MAG TPA: tetratricopeptide repeat protein [Phycisphaerae bacterium]|nr:tetratricopeptide repeat protein [Phycisphaerae bacterium]HRR84609.1 tetratricopeptide repeat protein [Phycisphaerae bacterium]